MSIKDVTDYLETVAPRDYQEAYDNSGLLTGNPQDPVKGILVTLDCTEAVVQEAISSGANLIVAHHPIVFKGLKKLTGANYVERTVIQAIRHQIAIYAIHTNLDNVLEGVNQMIAQRIGLRNTKILVPRKDALAKLVTFIPEEHTETVLEAMHLAGAGQIGEYKNCSFRTTGTGTFMPTGDAQPHTGTLNQLEKVRETRVEVIFPVHLERKVMAALRQSHPYEEVAYYLSPLHNTHQEIGAGLVGELPEPVEPLDFLWRLRESMDLTVIRHTRLLTQPISKVAVCGGAGSFLLPAAIHSGAQVFVSADFKYHEFFDADDKIIVADIGHYESESHTKQLLVALLTKKFPTFAINFSNTVTNPVRYLYK